MLVLELDLTVLLFDQAAEFDEARKNVYSRQLALLLYEGYDDLPSVRGKDFRASVLALPNGKALLQNVSEVVSRIAASGAKNLKDLKEIRRLAVAHRDHDAIAQLTLIREIDHRRLSNLASELVVELGGLAKSFTALLVEMGNPGVILRQFANRA